MQQACIRHFGEVLLAELRDRSLGRALLAEMRIREQNPGQSLFTWIEEIDQLRPFDKGCCEPTDA